MNPVTGSTLASTGERDQMVFGPHAFRNQDTRGVSPPEHVAPRKREVSGSVGAALRLTALVELELRAIRTIYARKDLRIAPFDIRLKSAFSWFDYRRLT